VDGIPEWRWTEGSLDDQGKTKQITAIWTLANGYAAVDTRDRDDPTPSTFRTSTDGLHWMTVNFPERGFSAEFGVVQSGALMLVGRTGPDSALKREIWSTLDGRSWSRVKGTSGLDFGPGSIRAMVRGDTAWLALGREWLDAESATSHLLASPDGRAWTELLGPTGGLGGLAGDGRRFVSVVPRYGPEPGPLDVNASDDGRHWSTTRVAELARWESSGPIAATASGFAIAGQRFEPSDESSHPIGWTSRDGSSWVPSRFRVLAGPDGEAAPREIVASASGLIAHGNGDPLEDALWLSVDGIEWTQITPLPKLQQVNAYARAGNDVIVAGLVTEGGAVGIWRGTQVR
jgi:hypothetical protein